MYHEVNGTHGCDAEMVLEMTRGEPVEPAKRWDDLNIDDLTIEIMKIAISWPAQYEALQNTFQFHSRPQALSPLEQRIRQIFLNLAKGNTHATDSV